MKRDDFGVWEVTVPPLPSGACAIPHDTKVKVGMHCRRFFSLARSNSRISKLDFHDPSFRAAH
jgi:hypothetical protein